MNDEVLMKEYARGSEAAFMKLYEAYSPMVYGYARKRLRADEVDDFYQKVWRQLHEKRAVYKGQPFAPWFFVLIRNLLTDEYRLLRRKEVIPPVAEVIDVREILEGLTPKNRELVEKDYLEELSYEELSQELGVSAPGLRQRISRLIRNLRRGLQDE